MMIFNEPVFNPNVSQKSRELFLDAFKIVDKDFPRELRLPAKIDVYIFEDHTDGWWKTIYGMAEISSLTQIYRLRKNLKASSRDEILATIFHETFHQVRYEAIRPIGDLQRLGNTNLFAYIVDEGLAMAFEDEMDKRLGYDWGKDINLQRSVQAKNINKHFGNLARVVDGDVQDFDKDEWLDDNDHFGYRFGYHVVKKYCKQFKKNPSELAGISWRVFWDFAKSIYGEKGGKNA
jgi:hypothetical protein